MKHIKNILYILTLISLPITITLGIVYSNPFIYIITLILLGTTIVANYLYVKRIGNTSWDVVAKEDMEDELLYQEFLHDSIKEDE